MLNNLRYLVNYDYDTYYPCHNGSDCCKDDYCRCCQITNARVTDIPPTYKIVKEECDKNWSEIDKYCIERILSIYKVWDKHSWEVNVCGGYYGEEIDGVEFDKQQEVNQLVNQLRGFKNDATKIEFVLDLEYGHVLDEVKQLRWNIVEVLKDQIKIGQKDHYHKLDREVVDYYKDYDLPRGIVLSSDKNYRLIDGYHRVAAGPNKFKVIVGSKK